MIVEKFCLSTRRMSTCTYNMYIQYSINVCAANPDNVKWLVYTWKECKGITHYENKSSFVDRVKI